MSEPLKIPDAGLRDPREMDVWDSSEESREERHDLVTVFRFGYVVFKHPDVSGSVQVSGPPPIVRLTIPGSSHTRDKAPVLAVVGAPKGFGECVEWVVAKAVERYDLCERFADNPSGDPGEVFASSGFDIYTPDGCKALDGRSGFGDKLELAKKGDKHALAWLQRFPDRTALVELIAQTPFGRISATIDGRDLPVQVWSERYPAPAKLACRGLRAGGVCAQPWGNELAAELFAQTTGVGEALPGAGPAVDFTRGLEDWPAMPDEDVPEDLRDFLRDVQLTKHDFVSGLRRGQEERERKDQERQDREDRQMASARDEIRMRGGQW